MLPCGRPGKILMTKCCHDATQPHAWALRGSISARKKPRWSVTMMTRTWTVALDMIMGYAVLPPSSSAEIIDEPIRLCA